MRWLVIIGMGCILLLLVGCQADDSPPTGIIEILPTRFLVPSPTATSRPTRTPLPTHEPIPTYALPSPTPDGTATPTPVKMVKIVVAVQPISAGNAIPPDAVRTYLWPAVSVPYGAITRLDNIINQVALADIACHQPILKATLARRTAGSGFLPQNDRCMPLMPLRSPVVLVDIIFAVQAIPAGAIISPSMIALQPWPEQALPYHPLTTFADVIGSTAQVAILQGQPMKQDDIH